MGEEKQVQVNVKFTALKLLNYAALAAVLIGVIMGIVDAAGSGASGPIRFGAFLYGALYGIFFGGVLLAFAELVKAKE